MANIIRAGFILEEKLRIAPRRCITRLRALTWWVNLGGLLGYYIYIYIYISFFFIYLLIGFERFFLGTEI